MLANRSKQKQQEVQQLRRTLKASGVVRSDTVSRGAAHPTLSDKRANDTTAARLCTFLWEAARATRSVTDGHQEESNALKDMCTLDHH